MDSQSSILPPQIKRQLRYLWEAVKPLLAVVALLAAWAAFIVVVYVYLLRFYVYFFVIAAPILAIWCIYMLIIGDD